MSNQANAKGTTSNVDAAILLPRPTDSLVLKAVDLIAEAIDVQAGIDEATKDKTTFNTHLIQFAIECQTVDMFDAAMNQAEQSKRMGRVPAGVSKAEALLWKPLPQAYKTAKSEIRTAWKDYGLIPGSKVTVKQKTPKGEVVEKTITLDSASKLATQAKRMRKAKADAEAPAAQTGITVTAKGEQVTASDSGALHTGDLTIDAMLLAIADKAGTCSNPAELVKKLKALAKWVDANQTKEKDSKAA